MKKIKRPQHVAGWREWAQLPDLGVELIKVKLDTGAKTSAIHAFEISTFMHLGLEYVQFDVHPFQDNDQISNTCICPVKDHKWITSSTGHRQKRIIIQSTLKMGEVISLIDISLAKRDEMGFRMLIGRDALKGRVLVDPAHSFLLGHRKRVKKKVKNL